MSFKIVQTIEGGKNKLTIVPERWEAKEILWWPSKSTKNAGTLIKDGNSKPGPGWTALKCTLKRKNIKTYQEATMELYHMEQNADTDQENDYQGPRQSAWEYALPQDFPRPQSSKTNQSTRNVIDFEAMASNLTNASVIMDDIQTPQQTIPLQEAEQETTVQIISTDNLNTMLSNQTAILNQLNSVLGNQNNIARKLASLTVQLDETNKEIRLLKQGQEFDVTMLRDASVEERESFSLKPIDNFDDLEIFESNLTDKTYKKKLIKCLSTLYSSKPGQGQTCAYKLIDILLTKDFLCQCSWSGGSKGDRSKIPMKNYTNFRKFFFGLVNMWDPSFTDDQMVKFFKLILRNATKRKSMQGLRESTKRARKTKRARTSKPANEDDGEPTGEGGDDREPTGEDGGDRQPTGEVGDDRQPTGEVGDDRQPTGEVGDDRQPTGEVGDDRQPTGEGRNNREPTGEDGDDSGGK